MNYTFPDTEASTKPSSSYRAKLTTSARSKRCGRFTAKLEEPKELVVIDAADHLFDGRTQEVGEALEELLADFEAERK